MFAAGFDIKFSADQKLYDVLFDDISKNTFRKVNPKFRKPIIAAVNGMAFGGAFEYALECDIVIASEDATISMPELKYGQNT